MIQLRDVPKPYPSDELELGSPAADEQIPAPDRRERVARATS